MELRRLALLLLSFACLQATYSGRFGKVYEKSGKASLFVSGEDKDGVVQTLLENLGLWDEMKWVTLYHFKNHQLNVKQLNQENLEESVHNLKKFTLMKEHYSWRCICYALPMPLALWNFEHLTKSPIFIGPVVFVQIANETAKECTSNGPNCTNALRTVQYMNQKGVLISTSAPNIAPFVVHSSVNGTNLHQIHASFIPNAPSSTEAWKKIWDARKHVYEALKNIGPRLATMERTSCHALVPDQSACTGAESKACLNFTQIPNEIRPDWKKGDPRDCPGEPYCRKCFGPESENGTIASLTSSTATTVQIEDKSLGDFENSTTTEVKPAERTSGTPFPSTTQSVEPAHTRTNPQHPHTTENNDDDNNSNQQSHVNELGHTTTEKPKTNPKIHNFPSWAIVLIACAITLVILIAIVFAFILYRRQRNINEPAKWIQSTNIPTQSEPIGAPEEPSKTASSSQTGSTTASEARADTKQEKTTKPISPKQVDLESEKKRTMEPGMNDVDTKSVPIESVAFGKYFPAPASESSEKAQSGRDKDSNVET